MSLTKHQTQILNESIEILKNKNRLLIKGNAGTGKTYLVKELIKTLKKKQGLEKVYCTAPTHKAVSVLKNKTQEEKDIRFLTLHSALKLKRFIDESDGKQHFKPSFHENYAPLSDVEILVVDEASMIEKEILGFIETYSNKFGVKVILIGDNKQINPVKEYESPAFFSGYPELELKEIIRQESDNPIISLSRNLHLLESNVENLAEKDKGYLFTTNEEKIIIQLANVNGTDKVKYLAWKNHEVNRINKAVRKKIYSNPNKIEIGETLIFNNPYKDRKNNNFFTNEEIKIDNLEVLNYCYKFTNYFDQREDIILKYYYCQTKRSKCIAILHEDSEKDFKKIKSILRKKCNDKKIKWESYYSFINLFADTKYNHAITVHKSQGSTYECVILNINDLKKNISYKERKRLIYTGITRASDLLVIYKPKI